MKPMHQKCCLLASVYSLFVLLVSSLVWDRRACAGVASHLLPYTVPTWPICKTLDTSTTDRSSGTNKMQQLIRVNNNKKKWKLSPMLCSIHKYDMFAYTSTGEERATA